MFRWASAILVIVLPFCAGTAAAQDPAREQAREHFELGVRLIEQGRWNDAARELEAARAIFATAPVLYNLGIALRGVGRFCEAIAVFEEFLAALGQGAAARRREVEGYVAELRAALGRLSIAVEPPGATVLVDGVALEPGSRDVELDPGEHRIRVEAEGYEAAFRDVTLERAGQAAIDVRLEEIETMGRLRVESRTDGAQVALDGRAVGAPPFDERLDPGAHTVVVTAPGHEPLRRELELRVGEVIRLQADLTAHQDVATEPWFWGLVGGGVAIAAGVVALVLVFTLSGTEQPFVGELGVVTGLLGEGRP